MMAQNVKSSISGRPPLERAAEVLDWLAFASVLVVVWLVDRQWGFVSSALAGMAYGCGVLVAVGYLHARLRLRSASKAGGQSAIRSVPHSEVSDRALMRLMPWFTLALTSIGSAGYWVDFTLNESLFRSFYILMGSILGAMWGLIGIYYLLGVFWGKPSSSEGDVT